MPRVPYETKVDGVCAYLEGGKSIPDLKSKYPGIQYDLNDLKVLEGVSERKGLPVDEVQQMIEKTKLENRNRGRKKQKGSLDYIFRRH
jgi:hypothetical protein